MSVGTARSSWSTPRLSVIFLATIDLSHYCIAKNYNYGKKSAKHHYQQELAADKARAAIFAKRYCHRPYHQTTVLQPHGIRQDTHQCRSISTVGRILPVARQRVF